MKRKILCLTALLAMLISCGIDTNLKAFIGGGMLDTTQMVMVDDSIILMAGNNIRASGHRSITPLPAAAEKIDMKGRYLIPIPATLDEKELDTAALTMEKLKDQIEVRRPVILGIPQDTTEWEPHTLALLRAQRTKLAPQLSKMAEGPGIDIARKNTKRMLDEEVRIIIGPGVDAQKEMAALAAIGFDNKSLMLAYFQNANLNAGADANIDIIKGNPLSDWHNLFQLEKRILAGQTQAAK